MENAPAQAELKMHTAPYLLLLFVFALPVGAQDHDTNYSPAHLCSRCHLHDMLEWSISGHSKADTACTSCHGPSEGHLIDERNNIKPDRVPHGEAIATLCQSCHSDGCPSTKRPDDCQSCHHVHALVDVSKQPSAESTRETEAEHRRQYQTAMSAGEQLTSRRQYREALAQYERALRIRPSDERAGNRTLFCRRRLAPEMPGVRVIGDRFDPASGLPLQVESVTTGIRLILVPAGDADLGDPKLPASRLVHTVTVAPFYLGRYEITQQQWQQVMGNNPSHYQTGFPDAANMPVESVSWNDTQQFLQRLNTDTPGATFRLPTEAEWEFAARAATTGDLPSRAWYRDTSSVAEPGLRDEPPDFAAPHPVGTKRPNALGLHDLEGNVWEWCSSLLEPYPYRATDGREAASAGEATTAQGLRILRGGSFVDQADLLNPAFRHGERPDRRIRWNGFRLAWTPPAPIR
jgi:formylglycine-generating enzyme required for sulfatase activity